MAASDSTRSTGATMVDDLRALTTGAKPARKQLKALDPIGALAAKRGRADYTEPDAPSSTGIASPLSEPDFTAREFWPEKVITSTDGLFSFKIKPIKSLRQLDANNAEVIQQFAEPVEAP